MTQALKIIVEQAWENRQNITPDSIDAEVSTAVNTTLSLLGNGKLRVAEPTDSGWQVNQWVKKAVLLSFKTENNQRMNANGLTYFDKVPLKYNHYSDQQLQQEKVRIVQGAIVRHASYIGAGTVIMPSFINIGAHVDSGCMIDTWATVGSCAQIGKNVHLSGGAGIGGVLEPLQANPTIIEDNCFIGARSEVVEGVIVEKNCVISMGVFIGQSTKIYNRVTGEIHQGRVPTGSVVVSGSIPAKDGTHNLYAPIIVKHVDEKTRSKVSINELLREVE